MATLAYRVALPVMICLIFVACAFTSQTTEIDPEIDLVETDEGHGNTVYVKVIDERPEKILGHRGAAFISKGAQITTDQDMESLVRDELLIGLAKKGFNPISCSVGEEPNLKVEIRLFEYYTSTGFWTGGIHTKAAIKAIANSHGNTYENFYRVDNEDRVVFVPTADTNQEHLNKLMTDILIKLFDDKELMMTLAK